MSIDQNAPLPREIKDRARTAWEDTIKHKEPMEAWKATVVDRGFQYNLPTADGTKGKFCSIWESASAKPLGEVQLDLAAQGMKNVNLCYRIRFVPGYNECPDAHKIVNMLSNTLQGWPTNFKVNQEVMSWNWRNESGYVQWGMKA